jgi:hypothetical protein
MPTHRRLRSSNNTIKDKASTMREAEEQQQQAEAESSCRDLAAGKPTCNRSDRLALELHHQQRTVHVVSVRILLNAERKRHAWGQNSTFL